MDVICNLPAEGQPEFTAEAFLTTLRRSNPIWWKNPQKKLNWVFRGHANSGWRLLPIAHRSREEGNLLWNLIDLHEKFKSVPIRPDVRKNIQFMGCNVASLTEKDLILRWCCSEVSALHDFCERANNLGLPVRIPKGSSPLHDRQLRTDIIAEFFPNEQWLPADLLALAQHHGVPTRLLDWTNDPVIAAFHATNFGTDKLKKIETDITVWALRTRDLPNYEFKESSLSFQPITFINPARHENEYLLSQNGVLTVVPFSNRYYYQHKRWPDIESIFRGKETSEPVLYKITLKRKYVRDLIEILHKEGLTKAQLMPTFDNVAQELMADWSEAN